MVGEVLGVPEDVDEALGLLRARRISRRLVNVIPQLPTEKPTSIKRTSRTTEPDPSIRVRMESWCGAGSGASV